MARPEGGRKNRAPKRGKKTIYINNARFTMLKSARSLWPDMSDSQILFDSLREKIEREAGQPKRKTQQKPDSNPDKPNPKHDGLKQLLERD